MKLTKHLATGIVLSGLMLAVSHPLYVITRSYWFGVLGGALFVGAFSLFLELRFQPIRRR